MALDAVCRIVKFQVRRLEIAIQNYTDDKTGKHYYDYCKPKPQPLDASGDGNTMLKGFARCAPPSSVMTHLFPSIHQVRQNTLQKRTRASAWKCHHDFLTRMTGMYHM
eukprot:COSAG05_NODE_214_length_13907_cov_28.992178_14_plen_108_part_00